MSVQLGPIDVSCDAPPYPIVQACAQIGLQKPEDVPWCRLSRHRRRQTSFRQLMSFSPWNIFFAGAQTGEGPCGCGQMLPVLTNYIFALPSGQEFCLGLVQCDKCRAIYWEEA